MLLRFSKTNPVIFCFHQSRFWFFFAFIYIFDEKYSPFSFLFYVHITQQLQVVFHEIQKIYSHFFLARNIVYFYLYFLCFVVVVVVHLQNHKAEPLVLYIINNIILCFMPVIMSRFFYVLYFIVASFFLLFFQCWLVSFYALCFYARQYV